MSKTLMTARRESQGERGKEKAQSAWRRAHSGKAGSKGAGGRRKEQRAEGREHREKRNA